MSDQQKVLYNSYRFTSANSARIDVPGKNRGELTDLGITEISPSTTNLIAKKQGFIPGSEAFWSKNCSKRPFRAQLKHHRRSCGLQQTVLGSFSHKCVVCMQFVCA
jgi:hypothetical protein